MTRDEILDAITYASTLDPKDTGPDEIQSGMRTVVELADEYMDNETGDAQYLAEALTAALDRFADALQPYA